MRPDPSRARSYELMTIFSPEISEEELVAAIEHVGNLVVNAGGTIRQINREAPWGRRRLAYPVRYQGHDVRDGMYVLYFIDLAANKVIEVERDLKLTVTLMRFLVLHQVQEPQPLPSELAAEEQAAEEAAAAMAAAEQALNPPAEPEPGTETESEAAPAETAEVPAEEAPVETVAGATEATESDASAPEAAETETTAPSETEQAAASEEDSAEPAETEAEAEVAETVDEPSEDETAADAGAEPGEEG